MSSMRTSPPVVFYRYEASPLSAKVQDVLALKNLPHYRVETAMTLPRPEISEALGIGYRRMPILAIGNDVYCDTNLIIPILEQCFPAEKGYPTIYPRRKDGGNPDTGMLKALATFYMDRPLFNLASNSLPWNRFAKDFIEDRGKWFGSPINVEGLMARQPLVQSQISSHITLLEEQLADGREWLFDTVTPSLADVAAFTIYGWVVRFKAVRATFSKDKFPMASKWMDRMASFVKHAREANEPVITRIDGAAAAKIIADNRAAESPSLTFDTDEAGRLRLKQGEEVQVVPEDNARDYPTKGVLVGLSREEFVLELRGAAVPSLRCHFPRLNYNVRSIAVSSKL